MYSSTMSHLQRCVTEAERDYLGPILTSSTKNVASLNSGILAGMGRLAVQYTIGASGIE